jgi:hypothetical protein
MSEVEDCPWSLCACSTHANMRKLYLPTTVRVAIWRMVPVLRSPDKHSIALVFRCYTNVEGSQVPLADVASLPNAIRETCTKLQLGWTGHIRD